MTTHMQHGTVSADAFRQAMAAIPGAVGIVTVQRGDRLSGFTATAISSFSADPPTILVCINRASSSWDVLRDARTFGVNLLGAGQDEVADRFAGRYGHTGRDRFEDARWTLDDVPVLRNALVTVKCELDHIVERYSHAIVLGRVTAVELGDRSNALLYWQGNYERLGWTDDELSNAIGLCPDTWPIDRSVTAARVKG